LSAQYLAAVELDDVGVPAPPEPPPADTTSVPCIDGWTEQWNGYEPAALGAVKVAVPPAGTLTLKPPAESAVTVCATESWFVTVIEAAGATLDGVLNAKLEMVILSTAAD
jgi:hypothetical protein